MDAVEKANSERQKKWFVTPPFFLSGASKSLSFFLGQKIKKSVRVLTLSCIEASCLWASPVYWSDIVRSGREASTGRKVAIKKIKVGQFKDGLDMSAIREVKYLRELQHRNVIEVSLNLSCYFVTLTLSKLLDVFSSKTNLNLVLEFLDTDLEMIIKDRALVFLPADIKSWMAMTFRGLEYCHRNFILHRVNN